MFDDIGIQGEARGLLANLDGPAFVRRGRDMRAAEGQFFGICLRERSSLLKMPRTRLAYLHAVVGGDWPSLDPHLQGECTSVYLEGLFADWQPTLRADVSATFAFGRLRRAISDLAASFDRFNRRWSEYLATIDLTEINAACAAYNKYYIIEKTAIIRSEAIAKHGFEELPPLTLADVEAKFPRLHVPQRVT